MQWKVGQTVMVQSRTWANINKPGGCAKITKVHTNREIDNLEEDEVSFVEGLDVKYVVGGGREKNLDPAIVSPFETLERGGRSRRGREFLLQREEDVAANANANTNKNANTNAQPGKSRRRGRPTKAASASVPAPVAPGKENQTQEHREPRQHDLEPPSRKSKSKSTATCSTPEPVRRKRKKLPKKVTPIPKMVLIDTGKEADEVSPMWMDAAVASSSSSSTMATTSAAAKKQPTNGTRNPSNPPSSSCRSCPQKESVARGLDFDGDIPSSKLPSLPNALLPPPKRNSSSLQTNSDSKLVACKNRKRPPPSKVPPCSILPSKKTKRSMRANPLPSQRYHLTNSKPRAKFSINNTQNKTTNTKQQQLGQSTHKPPRKPLLDVYRSEVEKARKFMDEMVGAPRTNDCGDPRDNLQTAPSSGTPSKSRYEEFLSHLYKVWIKVDGEEEISEDRFKVVFQKVSGGIFSGPELETHLSALCEEGKEVMRSDGMLYRIQ